MVDAPRRAHDADVDPAGPQPVVEATRPAGPRADPVDDDPHGDPLGGLGEQRAGEPLPDLTGTEAVLVDVDRRRRARDVLQDQREEVAPRHVDVDGRGRGLVEHQREVAELDLRARELFRAGADIRHAAIVLGARGRRKRAHTPIHRVRARCGSARWAWWPLIRSSPRSRSTSTGPSRPTTRCSTRSPSAGATARATSSPRRCSSGCGSSACARTPAPAARCTSGGSTARATSRSTSAATRWPTRTTELLAINWRAPAAEPFYAATPADPRGVSAPAPARHRGPRRARVRRRAARDRRRGAPHRRDRRRHHAPARRRDAPDHLDDHAGAVRADHASARRRRAGRAGRPRHRQDRGRPAPRRVAAVRRSRSSRARACWSSGRTACSSPTSRRCCRRWASRASSSGRSTRWSRAAAGRRGERGAGDAARQRPHGRAAVAAAVGARSARPPRRLASTVARVGVELDARRRRGGDRRGARRG